MNNDELYLMLKDKKNKRIKMHIKLDIDEHIHSATTDIYNYISYVFNLIDDKNLTTLKKNTDFHLTGLQELLDNNLCNDSRLYSILYNLESSLIQIVEWVSKTLDWPNFNLKTLSQIINGILFAKSQINKFEDTKFVTEQQSLLLENDIINMVKKFNEKINYRIKNPFLYLFDYYNPQYLKSLLIDFTPEDEVLITS